MPRRRVRETASVALGARVRRLRRRAGLTIEALAERAGIGAHYLGGVERGEQNPTLKVLVGVASALGVTLPALVAVGYEARDEEELRRELRERLEQMASDDLRLALALLDAVLTR